ncbi:MAG: hypothetical protein P4L22_01365 [Candidatus Babeliales bacterium]|nr:hypothetical protein [Candidatus Babeliales bacterium]
MKKLLLSLILFLGLISASSKAFDMRKTLHQIGKQKYKLSAVIGSGLLLNSFYTVYNTTPEKITAKLICDTKLKVYLGVVLLCFAVCISDEDEKTKSSNDNNISK